MRMVLGWSRSSSPYFLYPSPAGWELSNNVHVQLRENDKPSYLLVSTLSAERFSLSLGDFLNVMPWNKSIVI